MIRDDSDRAAYTRVEGQVRLTRYGGDCYAYCALAAGFVDLVIETNLKPHDIVALVPIIEGAGGVVTTWDGEPAAHGGRIIAAGDRAVYDRGAPPAARGLGLAAAPDGGGSGVPQASHKYNQGAKFACKKIQGNARK